MSRLSPSVLERIPQKLLDDARTRVNRYRRTPAGRKILARKQPTFFATHYMGLKFYEHQRRWLDQMYRLRASGRLQLLAPRSHGKTEAVISFVVQAIAENRNLRVLIVTKSADAARERLRKVKANLANNSRLIADYGPFKPNSAPRQLKGRTKLPRVLQDWSQEKPERGVNKGGISYWTDQYIYVLRESNDVNPTVKAIGYKSAVTGGRFDLIIFDDPTDAVQSASATERKRIRAELYDTYLPLLDTGGRCIVIGTRKHYDDLYETVKCDPTFITIHDKAIEVWPDCEPVYQEQEDGRRLLVDFKVHGEAKVLCPERYPFARPPFHADDCPPDCQEHGDSLMMFYYSALDSGRGTAGFIREYQNDVKGEGEEDFPKEFFFGGEWEPMPGYGKITLPGCVDLRRSYLTEAYPSGVLPEHLRLETANLIVYQAWDLAIVDDAAHAEARDTDYTVGLTFALDTNTWTRYLVSMKRVRGMHPNSILRLMNTEFQRFGGHGHVAGVVVENNAFQKIVQLQLMAGTDMPIMGHHTTGQGKADEFKGIPALSGLHEVGKIRYPYQTAEDKSVSDIIIEELRAFPNGAHKDILLAEYIGEQRAHLAHAQWEHAQARARKRAAALGYAPEDEARVEPTAPTPRPERREPQRNPAPPPPAVPTPSAPGSDAAPSLAEPDALPPVERFEGDIDVRPHALDHQALAALDKTVQSFGGFVIQAAPGHYQINPNGTVTVRALGSDPGFLRYAMASQGYVQEVLE